MLAISCFIYCTTDITTVLFTLYKKTLELDQQKGRHQLYNIKYKVHSSYVTHIIISNMHLGPYWVSIAFRFLFKKTQHSISNMSVRSCCVLCIHKLFGG